MRSWVTPRWVTGMPATAGTASGLLMPGITVHGDTGLTAGDHLLVAAAEDEVVAALEPGHPLAGEGGLDDDLVDLVLVGRAAARELGDVDDLGVGRAARRGARAARAGRRPRCRPPSAPCGRRPRSARGRPGHHRPARRPGMASRWRRTARDPSRSAVTISSRRLACRRGSRSAAELPITATVSPACRPTAGVKAVAAYASSARTQKIRCRSASSLTRSFTAVSSVAAITYQAPSRSPSSNPRSTQATSPEPTSPSIAGVTSGETTRTSAPAEISVGTRRWATFPPPTTRTLRPARRSPTG